MTSEAVDKHDTAGYQHSYAVCERAMTLLQVELLIVLLASGQPGKAVPVHSCHVCCRAASASR
jgi:hypothetical protein